MALNLWYNDIIGVPALMLFLVVIMAVSLLLYRELLVKENLVVIKAIYNPFIKVKKLEYSQIEMINYKDGVRGFGLALIIKPKKVRMFWLIKAAVYMFLVKSFKQADDLYFFFKRQQVKFTVDNCKVENTARIMKSLRND